MIKNQKQSWADNEFSHAKTKIYWRHDRLRSVLFFSPVLVLYSIPKIPNDTPKEDWTYSGEHTAQATDVSAKKFQPYSEDDN